MDKDKTESTAGSRFGLILVGLFLLFVVFSAYNLNGTIDWSLWLVFMPLWIIPAVVVGLAVGALVVVSTLIFVYWVCKMCVDE